jgi:chromosome segregation ATPase
MKPAIFALVVACLGLSAGLIIFRQRTESRVYTAEAQSARATAELEEVKTKFTDLEKLYAVQESVLSLRNEELTVASNGLVKATEELKTVQEEMTKRQDQITVLQSERDSLSTKMEGLTESIDKLETEIATTKKKLATAEGDRGFLLSELKRLQTERETLVRQFNDLAAMRTQVAKLKEEAAIKRRLEWKRAGVYAVQDQKGAERLTAKPWVMAKADNRLNADIYQDNRQLFPKATKDVPDGSTSVQPGESP